MRRTRATHLHSHHSGDSGNVILRFYLIFSAEIRRRFSHFLLSGSFQALKGVSVKLDAFCVSYDIKDPAFYPVQKVFKRVKYFFHFPVIFFIILLKRLTYSHRVRKKEMK